MTLLGIRYPKSFERSAMSQPALPLQGIFAGQSVAAGSPYVVPIAVVNWLFAAPARFSEVRKVIFFINVRAAAVSIHARLRIGAVCTSSANPIDPFPVPIVPGASVRIGGGHGIFPYSGFNPAHLFQKAGTASSGTLPVSGNQVTGACTTLVIEFDRFEAGSADFFAYWDSQTDPDAYLFFVPVLENTDGNFPNSSTVFTFANMGMTTVQAPSGGNKTCTIIPLTVGWIDSATMPADYTTGYRATLFDYIASHWDSITQINTLTWAFWSNANVRTFAVGVHKLTTTEPTASALLTETVFTDNALVKAAGDISMHRSLDIQGDLVDGALHHILYDRRTPAGNIDLPTSWIEIIQEDFGNTECHHTGGSQFRLNAASGGLYGSPACPVFDPTWYQAFPDELILEHAIQLAYSHADVDSDTRIRLHIDANLESNVTGLSNTSPSLAGINPFLNATPTAVAGTKVRRGTPSPDPINLAGSRRLVFGIVVPSALQTEFLATSALIYTLSVPTREFPEIGDVFSLDAFDPEGCASTAAGLGDPGVLILTNGTTIPQKFDPNAQLIQDAGIPAPFCDEAQPSYIVNDTSASPVGGLGAGLYRYRYTFRNCCTGKESNPNDADIEVDTSGASPAAEVILNFTAVRIPGDPQICEICLYRTAIDGDFPVMAKVGCFNPDDTSTFTDDLSDSALDFTKHSLSVLNGPMPCCPIVVDFRDRLFAMGDIPQLSPVGTVSVVNGSNIVTGSFDVEWNRCLEGKYLQLDGDCKPYQIDCVMPPEDGVSPAYGRLRLDELYQGDTRTNVLYTICGHPNRLYISEPFEAEYWPEANFIDVEPGDGDRLMGAVSNFDSLVLCKRRKTYVLRFNDDPVNEVACPNRISSDIGCIAPRSFAQVDSGSVWLADRGLALFDGRGVAMVEESAQFDDFFTDPDNANYVRRDSLGRVIGAVGVYYPKRKQYLLLLPTVQTVRGANMLMVWDTQLHNITVHRFCQEFLSMTVGKDSDGNQRVYLGDSNGFVWLLDIGDSDGVGFPGATGTVQGTVTDTGFSELGASFIEDEHASFIEGGLPALAGLSGVVGLSAALDGADLGLAGVCVFFRAAGALPDAPWSSRTVFAATKTRLYVTPSFTTDAPGVGFDYMVGAIDFRAEFKPTNWGDDDLLKRPWRQLLTHYPETVNSIVRCRLIGDFANSDLDDGAVVGSDGVIGDDQFNMNFSKGRQLGPKGRSLFNYAQVVISQFAPEAPVRILNHLLMVEPHTSK